MDISHKLGRLQSNNSILCNYLHPYFGGGADFFAQNSESMGDEKLLERISNPVSTQIYFLLLPSINYHGYCKGTGKYKLSKVNHNFNSGFSNLYFYRFECRGNNLRGVNLCNPREEIKEGRNDSDDGAFRSVAFSEDGGKYSFNAHLHPTSTLVDLREKYRDASFETPSLHRTEVLRTESGNATGTGGRTYGLEYVCNRNSRIGGRNLK